MIRPSLEEAKQLCADYTIIPLALEILADQKTSIEILRNLRSQSASCFILESVNGCDSWGRYTFLGYKPVLTLHGNGTTVTIKNGSVETLSDRNPVEVIREHIAKYKSPRIPELPPFTGGFVGYFSYDFVQHFIPGLTLDAKDSEEFPDFHLMMMDKVIAFDQLKQKIYLIVNIPSDSMDERYIEGVMDLKDMERMVLGAAPSGKESPARCGAFESVFSPETFENMVKQVKRHIFEGDIFQTVISNRYKAAFEGSLLDTYRILRTTNPSPYMVYMRLDDMEIACSSPETLVSLCDGEISVYPLAGTCARGQTAEEDAVLINALLRDEKELAEHDMLVDLARNDVGRVSRFGSVRISEYRQIKRFSHVSHIGSRVTGELREDLCAMDVIAATFPAGTLTGAPKKRACEIIDAVEGVKRGPYGGAIGYIDFAGNMDLCIGIRMAVSKNGYVYVQSGAGIVADSIPSKEYLETQRKARAVMDALLKNSGPNLEN